MSIGQGESGNEATDSKTLAKPIKRDKLDEIFQAQKPRITTGPMNYYLVGWGGGQTRYQVCGIQLVYVVSAYA